MDVHELAVVQVARRRQEPVVRCLFHEPEDYVDLAAGFTKRVQPGIVPVQGDVGHQVTEEVSGQRLFGKDYDIGRSRRGPVDVVEVQRQVVFQIAQGGPNLGQRQPSVLHGAPRSSRMASV